MTAITEDDKELLRRWVVANAAWRMRDRLADDLFDSVDPPDEIADDDEALAEFEDRYLEYLARTESSDRAVLMIAGYDPASLAEEFCSEELLLHRPGVPERLDAMIGTNTSESEAGVLLGADAEGGE